MKCLSWLRTTAAAILLPAAIMIGTAAPAAAAPILTLDPASGNVSGLPGATVGWGFNINNDTSSYLVVTSLTASGFTFTIGSLTDYIASLNFYLVAPNSTLPVAFNSATTQGTAAYAINAGALAGAFDGGSFTITYDLLVNDPNGAGGSDPGDQFGLEFDPLEVSVTVSAVPEPSTLVSLAAGTAVLAALRRRRHSA